MIILKQKGLHLLHWISLPQIYPLATPIHTLHSNMVAFSPSAAFEMVNFSVSIFNCVNSVSIRQRNLKPISKRRILSTLESSLLIVTYVQGARLPASSRMALVHAQHRNLLRHGYADTLSKDNGTNVIIRMGLTFEDSAQDRILIRTYMEGQTTILHGIQTLTGEILVRAEIARANSTTMAVIRMGWLGIQSSDGISMGQGPAATVIRGTYSALGRWHGMVNTVLRSCVGKRSNMVLV
jgi:hypothetical protein